MFFPFFRYYLCANQNAPRLSKIILQLKLLLNMKAKYTIAGTMLLCISLFVLKAVASEEMDMPAVGRKVVETQCHPLDVNECGPVAYSNNCAVGEGHCSDRGCPGGSWEDYIYP